MLRVDKSLAGTLPHRVKALVLLSQAEPVVGLGARFGGLPAFSGRVSQRTFSPFGLRSFY